MRDQFSLQDVAHALGVAPSTAERIAGLLNGRIHPDKFKSLLDDNPLAQFGTVLEYEKILLCIAYLLNAEVSMGGVVQCVDRGDDKVPTVLLHDKEFIIAPVSTYLYDLLSSAG